MPALTVTVAGQKKEVSKRSYAQTSQNAKLSAASARGRSLPPGQDDIMPLLARLDQLDVSVQSIRQRNQQKHELLNEERGLLHALLQERNHLHSTLLDLPAHAEGIRRESASLLSRLEEQELYCGISHDKAERGLLEQLLGFHRAQEHAQADLGKAKQALQEAMASQPADVAEAERLRRTSALVSRGPAAMAGAQRHMSTSCQAAIATARQSVSKAAKEAEQAEAELAGTQASVEDLRAKLAIARLGMTAGTRTSLQSWLRAHLRSAQAAPAPAPQQQAAVGARRGRSPEQRNGHGVQDLLSAFRRGSGRGGGGEDSSGMGMGMATREERQGTPGQESGRGSPQALPRYARPLERHVSPPPVPSQSNIPTDASLRGRLGLGFQGRQAVAARQGSSGPSTQSAGSYYGSGRKGSISDLLRELPDALHGARAGSPSPVHVGPQGGMSTSQQLLEELGEGGPYTGAGAVPPRPIRSSRGGQAPLPAWAEEDGARIAAALGPVTPRTARLIQQALTGNLEEEGGGDRDHAATTTAAAAAAGGQQKQPQEEEEGEEDEAAKLLRKVTFSPSVQRREEAGVDSQPGPALASVVAESAPPAPGSSFYSLFNQQRSASGKRVRASSRGSSSRGAGGGGGNAAGSSRDVWSQLAQPKQVYVPPTQPGKDVWAEVAIAGTRPSPTRQTGGARAGSRGSSTVFGSSLRDMSPPGAGRPVFNRPAVGLMHTVEHANRQAGAAPSPSASASASARATAARRNRSGSPVKGRGREQAQEGTASLPPSRATGTPVAAPAPPVRPRLSPEETAALVSRLYQPSPSQAAGRVKAAAQEESARAETGRGSGNDGSTPVEGQSPIPRASPSPSPAQFLRSRSAGASPTGRSPSPTRQRSGTPLSPSAAASALIARGAGTATSLMPSHSAQTGYTVAEQVAKFQSGGLRTRPEVRPGGKGKGQPAQAEGKRKVEKKVTRSQSARKAAPNDDSVSAAFSRNSAFSKLFDPSPTPSQGTGTGTSMPSSTAGSVPMVDGPDAESTADFQAMLHTARRLLQAQESQPAFPVPPSRRVEGQQAQGQGKGARAADLMAALKFIPPPGDDQSSRRTSFQSASTAAASLPTPHPPMTAMPTAAAAGAGQTHDWQGVTAIAAAPAAVQPVLESALVDALAKAFARATAVTDEDAEYEAKLEKEQEKRRQKVAESKAKIDNIKAKYAAGAARNDGTVVINNPASAHRIGDMELTAFAAGRRSGPTDDATGGTARWTAVAEPGQPDGPRRRTSTADAAAESAEQGVFMARRDNIPLNGPYHSGTFSQAHAPAPHGLPPALGPTPSQHMAGALRHEPSSDPVVTNGRSGSTSSRRLSRLGRRGTDVLEEHTQYSSGMGQAGVGAAGAPFALPVHGHGSAQGYQYPPTTVGDYGQPPAAGHSYSHSQPTGPGVYPPPPSASPQHGGAGRRGSANMGIGQHSYIGSSAQI